MNEEIRRGLVALIVGVALYLVSLLVGGAAVTPFRLVGMIAAIVGVVMVCHGLLSHERD